MESRAYTYFKLVLEKKRSISYLSILISLFFLSLIFTQPKEYEANKKLILMNNEGALLGSASSLASFAGINLPELGNDSEKITPLIYEDILRDRFFLNDILESKLSSGMSIRSYLKEESHSNWLVRSFKNTKGWFYDLLDSKGIPTLKNSAGIIKPLSKEDFSIQQELSDRIYFLLDQDKSILEIRVVMQNPIVSAEILDKTIAHLKLSIVDYIDKTKIDHLDFLDNKVKEYKKDFDRSNLKLATYKDNNTGLSNQKALLEIRELELENQRASNLYLQLVQSYEQVSLEFEKKAISLIDLGYTYIPPIASSIRYAYSIPISILISLMLSIGFFLAKHELIIKKNEFKI